MAELRYRKLYPKDIGASVFQKDLSGYNRIGVIKDIDTINGLCTVKWVDHPGTRIDVIITQGSSNEWHMPTRGSIVLVEITSKA